MMDGAFDMMEHQAEVVPFQSGCINLQCYFQLVDGIIPSSSYFAKGNKEPVQNVNNALWYVKKYHTINIMSMHLNN